MSKQKTLINNLQTVFGDLIENLYHEFDEVTVEVDKSHLKDICLKLRDDENFIFNQLIDICGVDYLTYGQSDWQTESSTESGFSRGAQLQKPNAYTWDKPRFSIVYHLLSTRLNHRLRIRVLVSEDSDLIVPSICNIWKSADWCEREVYDLYGILFEGHSDLRRILTDYGFIGFPFRKDFPLSGNVEMRYDATLKKVVYGPVEIKPRINVAKVIREDNRYVEPKEGNKV